jgi:hypothetical protein
MPQSASDVSEVTEVKSSSLVWGLPFIMALVGSFLGGCENGDIATTCRDGKLIQDEPAGWEWLRHFCQWAPHAFAACRANGYTLPKVAKEIFFWTLNTSGSLSSTLSHLFMQSNAAEAGVPQVPGMRFRARRSERVLIFVPASLSESSADSEDDVFDAGGLPNSDCSITPFVQGNGTHQQFVLSQEDYINNGNQTEDVGSRGLVMMVSGFITSVPGKTFPLEFRFKSNAKFDHTSSGFGAHEFGSISFRIPLRRLASKKRIAPEGLIAGRWFDLLRWHGEIADYYSQQAEEVYGNLDENHYSSIIRLNRFPYHVSQLAAIFDISEFNFIKLLVIMLGAPVARCAGAHRLAYDWYSERLSYLCRYLGFTMRGLPFNLPPVSSSGSQAHESDEEDYDDAVPYFD